MFQKKYKFIKLIILILIIALKVSAQSWKLVWSDEFEKTALDMTKWNYEKGGGGWGNNELEFYTDKKMNIDVLNGQLMIIARNESYKGFNYSSA